MSSNTRYDQFRFVESPIDDLTVMPPLVTFPYLGQYYYAIYECYTSGSTNPSLAYNQLESGRAVVIVGNDTEYDCLYEQFVSDNEENANIIFISEKEEECIDVTLTPTPSITPTNTPTPSITASNTPTPTITPTNTNTATVTSTNTPTPSDPRICTTYQIANTGFGGTTFNWTNCDGSLSSTTLSFGASLIICAKNGSVSYDINGIITNIGTCPLPTTTPTPTMTPTPTTPSTLLTFSATFGQSAYLACNSGTPVTIYAEDIGNCGGCLPGPCWACLTTAQQVFSNSSLTTIVPDGFYVVNGGVWEIIGGYPQPGGFFGCPPNPTPSPTAITHSYSWTGYTSTTSCGAYTGQTTPVTLYGNLPDIDNNVTLFDSPSGNNTTNMFGGYSMWNGSVWVCFNLDYDGNLIGGYNLCSDYC